jgi:hypothetical protein
MGEQIAIGIMATGWMALVVGGVCSVLWRRPDVGPSAWFLESYRLAAYPERFVRPERAGTVRRVFVVGIAMIVLGALVDYLGGRIDK